MSEEECAQVLGITERELQSLERNRIDRPDKFLPIIAKLTDFPEAFFNQPEPPFLPLGSLLWHNPELICANCKPDHQVRFADLLCDWPIGKGKTCDLSLCEDCAHEIGEDLHCCKIHYALWQRKTGKDRRINAWPPPKLSKALS